MHVSSSLSAIRELLDSLANASQFHHAADLSKMLINMIM